MNALIAGLTYYSGNRFYCCWRRLGSKGSLTNQFYHYYLYDADSRLAETYTSPNGDIPPASLGTHADATLQAKYYYYLHGPLKRIELGGNRQGIDFTYNIHGWVTAINDPNDATDENPWFEDDAFGVAFNYYGQNPGVPDSAVAGPNLGGGLYGNTGSLFGNNNNYRYGYQGQFSEYDEETRRNSFTLRSYDPVLGRWFVVLSICCLPNKRSILTRRSRSAWFILYSLSFSNTTQSLAGNQPYFFFQLYKVG